MTKPCSCCKEVKDYALFHKDAQKKDGLTSVCKECRSRSASKEYDKVKEKRKASSRAWKKRNPEKVREQVRRHRLKYLEEKRQYDRQRAKNNPEYFASKTAKRRAVTTSRTPSWLSEDELWMIEEAYVLAKMREDATGIKWHVDHIVPLKGKTVSGLHVPWNLQVIPATDNIKKGNKYDPS